MKTNILFLLLLGIVGLAGMGCDALKADDEDTSGVVTLEGQVLSNADNNPVANAFVQILPNDLLFETDENGFYSVDVSIDSTMDLRVIATKDGFSERSIEVLALAGRVIQVPTLRLSQTVAAEVTSGKASNILLLNQSTQVVGVRESGSEEVANLTFQLADSLGRPVVLSKSATVNFTLGSQPGGGEFIFPTTATTDNNGQVVVNLSAGSRAGVVQVVAESNIDGRLIRSLPVAVTIHGGLPDQAHFSVGPTRFNFPGLNTFGLSNAISVIVGDAYSNPVKPGTAVYFDTDFGVIEGSVQTNGQGRGSVALLSANPLPWNDGIATIRARTADSDQNEVVGYTPVVFSGAPVITISPATAQLDQVYTLTVTDILGNPLVQDTQISVKVEGTKVKAVGNTAVSLDDTAILGSPGNYSVLTGPGITEFTFMAVEDLERDEDGTPTVNAVTVKVAGGNGTLEVVLAPGAAPRTTTDGAALEVDGDVLRVKLIE